MAETAAPLVALLGGMLESNRFAPPATEKDLESGCRLRGDAILADARGDGQLLPAEARAFIRTMDATGPWRPVPIAITALYPAGPMATGLFADLVAEIEAGLDAAGPVDAAYVVLHGAMVAENDDDPDGTLLALVRRHVPRPARLIVTLDLHGARDFVPDTAGVKVPVTTPDATATELARALDELANQPAHRRQLAAAGFRYARSFDWAAKARRITALYEQIAQPASPPPPDGAPAVSSSTA